MYTFKQVFSRYKLKDFMRPIPLILLLNINILFACQSPKAQTDLAPQASVPQADAPQVGAALTQDYLPLLQGKRVALVVNHTSLVGTTHLVDTLLALHVDVKKIFAPEHGFRGEAGAGETIKDAVDTQTGLPVISLYGKNKKPQPNQLKDIDMVVFDIQDVGARFYTYISTMHYVMEACAEQGKPLLILDRPNPNGYYVDGPVLNLKLKSFVGMHPIPVVHGLTVGELAQMINGERWLAGGLRCEVQVIKAQHYTHADTYSLPVRPSPNLPNDQAVNLYPSLCLFEGTVISLGRGTPFPFQVLGYPDPAFAHTSGREVQAVDTFRFVPEDIPGVAMNPPLEGKPCFGVDLRQAERLQSFSLKYLIAFYQQAKQAGIPDFFNAFFDKLAGTTALRTQIEVGMKEEDIRKTWADDLAQYKTMRKKYLLYEDFE